MQYPATAPRSTFSNLKGSEMRILFTIATTITVFTTLALADSFSGKLLDTECLEQQKAPAACQATSNTMAFALYMSGKTYRFDDAGNQKAVKALRNRADRSADPNATAGPINATITGTQDGAVLKVESIEIQ
jgi:hypothetical protein